MSKISSNAAAESVVSILFVVGVVWLFGESFFESHPYIEKALVILVVIYIAWIILFSIIKSRSKTKVEDIEAKAFQALSTRWNHLPGPFLKWVASRLISLDKVNKFIYLSESHQLHDKFFPQIANEDYIVYNELITKMLMKIAEPANIHNPAQYLKNAEDALSLALNFQSKNSEAMLSLAVILHTQKKHSEALPLFEEGISLCKEAAIQYQAFVARVTEYEDSKNNKYEPPSHAIDPQVVEEYERMRDECLVHCKKEIYDR